MLRSRPVLVIEPDSGFRHSVCERLRAEGMAVQEACDAAAAHAVLRSVEPDLVLLALRLPDADSLSLLPTILAAHQGCCVIVMTAFSSIASAVEAMRGGTADYLPKPFSGDQLMISIRRAMDNRALRRQVDRLNGQNFQRFGLEAIIGESAALRDLRVQVQKIAASPTTTILVLGESGAGKDLVASAIHYTSTRRGQPFVPINCSAIPEALMESELFGHERGAFTDAGARKVGLLELADGGTAFLDEIAELPPPLQAKLLRFLEHQTFRRVGGTEDVAVEVRIVSATNADLEAAVRSGRFREDLYYRLHVVALRVPPLRERREDIAPLARHFLDHFNKKFRRHFEDFAPAAMERLVAHAWPGNVRELRNVIERILLLEDGRLVEVSMLLLDGPTRQEPTPVPLPEIESLSLAHLELQTLVRALERTCGNQSAAARLLGVSRDTVRCMMRRHAIELRAAVVVGRRGTGTSG
jgi:two-component system response regulator AtoC